MTHILVFGDSIAWGEGDLEGGWVDRLKKVTNLKNIKLFEEFDYWCMIYNQGVSGDCSNKLIKRLESEHNTRHYDGEDDIAIISIGLNDAAFLKSKNGNMTPIKEFDKNIQKLIDMSKNIFTKTIFLTITPVDETKTNPIPWATDMYFKTDTIFQFNDILKKKCAEKNVILIDIYELFIKQDYRKLLFDGLHPNTDGHKIIFDEVKKVLEKKKII